MIRMKKIFFALAIFLNPVVSWASQPQPWQMGFQEAATPVMEKIHSLHNLLLLIIFSIAVLVGALLLFVIFRFRASRNPTPSKTTHNTAVEIIWTLIPALILVVIAVPSFRLLFFMDKTIDAEMTLKITGRQWYWSYEYPDEKIGFDSTMIPLKEVRGEQLPLLDVDHPIVVPVGTNIRLLFTSGDVLHAWAVPAFGIKQDTIPGRLRETWVRVNKEGTYYGQCSELCGVGHGFMPIVVKIVSRDAYKKWLGEAKEKFAL